MFGIKVIGPALMSGYRNEFNKTALSDLRRFASQNGMPKRWFIASDYVFKGQNANKHTATFTLFPYNREFADMISEIQKAEPQDIKHTHGVSDKLMQYFKRNRFFPVVHVFDKWLPVAPGKDDVAALIEICESWKTACLWATERSQNWAIPEFSDTAGLLLDLISKLPKFNQDKVELFREFVVVVNIAACLTKMLRNEFLAEEVHWFTDRDPMFEQVCGAEYHRFVPAIYCLCSQTVKEASEYDKAPFSPIYEIPEQQGELRYKPLIRVADYFCGTFSRTAQEGVQIDESLNKLLYEYALSHPIAAFKVTNGRIGSFTFNVC